MKKNSDGEYFWIHYSEGLDGSGVIVIPPAVKLEKKSGAGYFPFFTERGIIRDYSRESGS